MGLVGSVAAARRRRVWAVRARRARAGRGHVYTSRRLLDYARAAAAAATSVWRWAWGLVQAEWASWVGARRRRPRVGGEERVHGRPPEGSGAGA